jgi:hypothetical protein
LFVLIVSIATESVVIAIQITNADPHCHPERIRGTPFLSNHPQELMHLYDLQGLLANLNGLELNNYFLKMWKTVS